MITGSRFIRQSRMKEIRDENKTDVETEGSRLLKHIESLSAEIQLLSLNIAVAAAKVTQNKNLGMEVNDQLSKLVNQATNMVKRMNQLLDAAKSDNSSTSSSTPESGESIRRQVVDELENSISSIIHDSEKAVRLLHNAKRKI